jgi:hypothetical protein
MLEEFGLNGSLAAPKVTFCTFPSPEFVATIDCG